MHSKVSSFLVDTNESCLTDVDRGFLPSFLCIVNRHLNYFWKEHSICPHLLRPCCSLKGGAFQEKQRIAQSWVCGGGQDALKPAATLSGEVSGRGSQVSLSRLLASVES